MANIKQIKKRNKKTILNYGWSYQPQDDREIHCPAYNSQTDAIRDAKQMYDGPLGKCYMYKLYIYYTDKTYITKDLNFHKEEENYYKQFVEEK